MNAKVSLICLAPFFFFFGLIDKYVLFRMNDVMIVCLDAC